MYELLGAGLLHLELVRGGLVILGRLTWHLVLDLSIDCKLSLCLRLRVEANRGLVAVLERLGRNVQPLFLRGRVIGRRRIALPDVLAFILHPLRRILSYWYLLSNRLHVGHCFSFGIELICDVVRVKAELARVDAVRILIAIVKILRVEVNILVLRGLTQTLQLIISLIILVFWGVGARALVKPRALVMIGLRLRLPHARQYVGLYHFPFCIGVVASAHLLKIVTHTLIKKSYNLFQFSLEFKDLISIDL